MDIERIGVIGCGLMGSGIAEVCAREGIDVVVVDARAVERAVDGELGEADVGERPLE